MDILKRKLFITLLVVGFIAVIITFGNIGSFPIYRARAEENYPTASQDELDEIIGDQLNKLDLKALQDYVNSLHSFTEKNVTERLLDYIKGTDFDYESFGKKLVDVLFKKAAELFPVFACITAITLLSGIISTLRSGSIANTSADFIFLISYAAALLPLLGVLIECFQECIASVSAMKEQMQIIFPLMLTLMAASGGTLSAAVCRPAVAFFSTTIVSIMSQIVFPLAIAIITFSMASNLTKELKIGKFTAYLKSINKWIIGLCITVFGLFLTLQGITAAAYDGVVRRATKYAIGNGIPIVGGFLSGGFDLAVAGSILIKNSLGNLGVFLMISVLFEPIVMLITVNLLLRFTAAITQPFGDSRISDFLGETADNLHYCTAGLLFTAFLYFLSIILMVCSTEGLI